MGSSSTTTGGEELTRVGGIEDRLSVDSADVLASKAVRRRIC